MDAALTAAFQSRVVAYVFVAALTAIVYDTLLVFAREKEYIWDSKWTVPKVLYIFCRYYGLFVVLYHSLVYASIHTSVPLCKAFFWATVIGGTPIMGLAATLILILRLNALYRSTCVRRAMIALFIVDIIINLFVMVRMAPELADNTFLAPPGLPIYGCLTMPKNVLPSVIAWIPCIVITVILFMMMAFKLFRPESLRLRRKDDNQPPHSPLVDAFFKDTALYFLVVLFMVTAGFVMTFTAKGPYTVLSLPWTLLTYSFAGSRLILRIREKAALSMANDSLPGGNSVQVARFVNPHAQDTQADSEFAEPEHCPSRSRSSPPVSDDHGIHVIPICRIISVPNSKSTPTPPNPP